MFRGDCVVEFWQDCVLDEVQCGLQMFEGLAACWAGAREDVDGDAQASTRLGALHQSL